MMDDSTRNEAIIDLEFDLNQEPLDPPTSSLPELEPLLNQLETAHDQIEERIRQLEAVTARARHRQRWRQAQNIPEASIVLTETLLNSSSEGTLLNGEYLGSLQERTVDRAKNGKRDSSHLVAKALELDSDLKRIVGEGRGFFDCNICLDEAKEPILTCCGHLFCWACFYRLPYVYSTAKECPVCDGEVMEANITPIYGNGKEKHVHELESGMKIPPRPKANRIDSIRQQRFSRGVSHIPVAEALRRIRVGIGATSTHPQHLDIDHVDMRPNRNNTDAQVPATEVSTNNTSRGSRLRSRQFSRLLSETAASLSTISTALHNPRLFEDLELFINDHMGNSPGQVLPVEGEDPLISNAAMAQSENQTSVSTAHINSAASHASSSGRLDPSASEVHVENMRPDAPAERNLMEPPSPSPSRRRNRLSRASNVRNGTYRESRGRRLS